MAFEVFDDVAFYWFLQVLLGIFLLPTTLYRINQWCTKKKVHRTRSHPIVDNIPDYIPSQKLVSEKQETLDNKLSLSNIFWCGLWILFLLLMIQLPKWHNREMTNFEPYEILNIQRGASEKDIKRAYRKMSLLHHPDKCTQDEDTCQQKFILITKAYQALTDEATKENYEKYGNPDGYQGTMVTIGLPSWLTNKDNELAILSVYFFGLILMVGIVGAWWQHSSKFHKSGVYKQSIDIYWRFMKQNMRMRHLLDILAASSEFRILDYKIPSDTSNPKYKQLQILEDQIISFLKKRAQKGQTPKLDNLFKASYVRRSSSLLHAHLIGLPVPEELKDEYLFVLQEAPRLIDVMIDMTLSRERFWAQGLQLIQLKQAIIQGVWPFESNLKQLPHWTEGINRALNKKGFTKIQELNFLNKIELHDILYDAYQKFSQDFSHLITGINDTTNDDDNEDLSHLPEHIRKIKEKQREIKKKQQKRKQYKNDNSSNETSDGPSEEKHSEDTKKLNKNKSLNKLDNLEYAPGTIEQSDTDVEQMVWDAEQMVRMYPVVKMDWCARTYDEKDVCSGDIVKVTVHLTRLKQPWEFTIETFKSVEQMDPPELAFKKRKKKKKSPKKLKNTNTKNKKIKNKGKNTNKKNKNKNTNKTTPGESIDTNNNNNEVEIEGEKDVSSPKNENSTNDLSHSESEGKDNIDNDNNNSSSSDDDLTTTSHELDFSDGDYDDEHGLDFVENDLDEHRRLQIARLNAPVVHVNRFPFRVKEKWMVILVDHALPAVVDQRAIPSLIGIKKVDLHFRINRPPGKYKYLLFARCDSYLGCDRHIEFILDVKEQEKRDEKKEEIEVDYKIPIEEEPEADPKWYYLWNENFWEFLLTLFLLYFIYLVLVSSSWGKKWIQPYVEMFLDYCIYPITNTIYDKLGLVIFEPLSKQILSMTGFDLRKWWFNLDDDDDFDGFFDRDTGNDE